MIPGELINLSPCIIIKGERNMGQEYFQCTDCKNNFKASTTSPKRLEITKKKGGIEILTLCNSCYGKKISELRTSGTITKKRAKALLKG